MTRSNKYAQLWFERKEKKRNWNQIAHVAGSMTLFIKQLCVVWIEYFNWKVITQWSVQHSGMYTHSMMDSFKMTHRTHKVNRRFVCVPFSNKNRWKFVNALKQIFWRFVMTDKRHESIKNSKFIDLWDFTAFFFLYFT